ncbi:hypothetical protein AB9T38_05905 [Campylobacter hepaticus]
MAGEFFMIYNFIDPNRIKQISKLSDEVIKSVLANDFLNFTKGFKNISKNQFKREFARFLLEKKVKDKDILKITKLSRTTLWRLKNESKC